MGDQQIASVRERLAGSQRMAVLTGSGVSAESGVPTFRGRGGLWEERRPQDMATPQAFAKAPELVWRWYHWRRGLIADCRPNSAHRALAEREARSTDFTLITQNVDGLHVLAGSRNVLEIHGSIWKVRCTGCGYQAEARGCNLPSLPSCPQCSMLLRPGVVWFGEFLDPEVLDQAWRAVRACDAMLVAGTSALVQPAAGLATAAKEAGAFVVEVNLEPTPQSGKLDATLLGKAGEILPAILD